MEVIMMPAVMCCCELDLISFGLGAVVSFYVRSVGLWCRYSARGLVASSYKGKGKVHPCTGTEVLYRLYGP